MTQLSTHYFQNPLWHIWGGISSATTSLLQHRFFGTSHKKENFFCVAGCYEWSNNYDDYCVYWIYLELTKLLSSKTESWCQEEKAYRDLNTINTRDLWQAIQNITEAEPPSSVDHATRWAEFILWSHWSVQQIVRCKVCSSFRGTATFSIHRWYEEWHWIKLPRLITTLAMYWKPVPIS